ncbi:ergothioneine biosynthesis protein EgtC [Arthrobacter sp. I2-34]|uniref:Gamma-glutamyl-hercynylcysteine sulfoxide hydrolase n=1 Tax=Arthrobacter hankyongi TaxID=2904801 RepID=A0ABS9LAQ9_9MICC|nr:ergothioneine biosynthesis protein EgtC [Arthrobacter hankyongi]MCG2623668.1 ergothioneine biosynthesis protein EgtC [Arthrobacter hankyongi]
MCRHLAYLGNEAAIASVVIEPVRGLYRQAWAPRLQRYGTVNADGFGVGWYPDDGAPARYRRAVPMWADRSFADIARVTRTRCLLATVRSATPGMPPDESAAAPFASGRWLFSHNGAVDGGTASLEGLAAALPVSRLLTLESTVDSALLWALVLARLDGGEAPAPALGSVAADASAAAPGRYNFLLTDGERIAATAWGDTLFWTVRPHGTIVASEPADDLPDWNQAPDRTVLVATRGRVDIEPIHPARKETAAP